MLVLIFPILNWKACFGANFLQKIKNDQFTSKFGTKTNPNMLNLMSVFHFLYFTFGKLFLGKFGQKKMSVYVEI